MRALLNVARAAAYLSVIAVTTPLLMMLRPTPRRRTP